MKVVIAIDSFKGSLTSLEAGNSAAAGIRPEYVPYMKDLGKACGISVGAACAAVIAG